MAQAMRESYFSNKKVILELALYDFRAQYLGSAMGFLWCLIQPVALAGIHALIFSSVIPIEFEDGLSRVNQGLYIFSGMLPWIYLQNVIQRSARVFTDQAGLLKESPIPRFILPLQVTISATVSGFVAIIAFMIVQLIVHQSFSLYWPAIFLILLIQVFLAFALSLIAASSNVFLRDMEHLVGVLMVLWLFITPIFYPAQAFPETLDFLLWLNPLHQLAVIYRNILLAGTLPPLTAITTLIGQCSLALLLGYMIYRRVNQEVTDWL